MACLVCKHEDRAEIEAGLIRGITTRELAKQFGGVSRVTIARHGSKCASAAKARRGLETKAVKTAEAIVQEDVLARVRRISAIYQEQLEKLLVALPLDDAPELAKTLVKLLELEAKLTGEMSAQKVEHTVTQLKTPADALGWLERQRPALLAQMAQSGEVTQ